MCLHSKASLHAYLSVILPTYKWNQDSLSCGDICENGFCEIFQRIYGIATSTNFIIAAAKVFQKNYLYFKMLVDTRFKSQKIAEESRFKRSSRIQGNNSAEGVPNLFHITETNNVKIEGEK